MSDASTLHFTDHLITRVFQLISEEGNPALKLRVFITGGGCSGFQYGFTFDETVNADDMVIEKIINSAATNKDDGKVTLVVDSVSLQYLAGAKIDYRKDVSGEQFVISNPHAKTTCGCGSSFSVEGTEA